MESRNLIRLFASAEVEGSAQFNLQANVPLSQAGSSVTINISSGKAHAQVSAQEPPRKKKPKKAAPSSILLIKEPGDQN